MHLDSATTSRFGQETEKSGIAALRHGASRVGGWAEFDEPRHQASAEILARTEARLRARDAPVLHQLVRRPAHAPVRGDGHPGRSARPRRVGWWLPLEML
jgi:hypothetical protein